MSAKEKCSVSDSMLIVQRQHKTKTCLKRKCNLIFLSLSFNSLISLPSSCSQTHDCPFLALTFSNTKKKLTKELRKFTFAFTKCSFATEGKVKLFKRFYF
jgi:hypothetical protein